MRLLLVDDDPDIRLLAGFVLEAAGHHVTFAESGRAGIDAASAPFDLVVLDYRLGDMTGAEVLTTLRRASPDRPVVVLTGADDAALIRDLLDAGAADVIAKPFDPESLAARLERIARGERAR